jgi:hypothetical protein
MKCVICEARKPRRYCPGVRGDICSVCCGTERENTVDCPFECPYLRESRLHEKEGELDEQATSKIPFLDIRVPERYLHDNADCAQVVTMAILDAIFSTRGAIDYDVREALEALIRTHKTLQSGLVYESRPTNPIAGEIYDRFQSKIAEDRGKIAAQTGLSVRDADIMAMLLILHRQEYLRNNGRKRGRAFIDYLREFYPTHAESMNPGTSPLIV